MRKASDTFKPEGSELEGIGRASLNAAWHALQHLNDENLSTPEKVLVCIAAFFKAAKAMEAMQAFDAALDNDDEIFGTWMADKTTDLAAEVLKAREELRALHKAKSKECIT